MTFPIILAHGVCRFDKVWSDSLGIDNNDNPKLDNMHYFKSVHTMLKKNGFLWCCAKRNPSARFQNIHSVDLKKIKKVLESVREKCA